jgi:hypothetical protein
MRIVILTLALLGQTSNPIPPATPRPPAATAGENKDAISKAIEIGRADVTDKWFAIEYLGHFDDRKAFVYNRARLLAPVVAGEVLNFGVDAPNLNRSPTGAQGNDQPFQRRIEADVKDGPRKFESAVPVYGHAIHTGPCPGPGPCPNPKPDARPLIPDPFIQPRRDPMDHLVPVLIAVAVTAIFVGGALITIGAVAFLLTHRKPPTP